MYEGKLVFAQLIDHLPMHTFRRSVARYDGDRSVKRFTCQEQYRAMAFAQLTYRESLRDIEICLSAQASKLYHMGFREPVRRSTLADANETRPWRIHADFAQRLIVQARKLYADTDLGLDLKNSVYALDSTTIDLCLSVLPWARCHLRHGPRVRRFCAAFHAASGRRFLRHARQVEHGCEAGLLGRLRPRERYHL